MGRFELWEKDDHDKSKEGTHPGWHFRISRKPETSVPLLLAAWGPIWMNAPVASESESEELPTSAMGDSHGSQRGDVHQ